MRLLFVIILAAVATSSCGPRRVPAVEPETEPVSENVDCDPEVEQKLGEAEMLRIGGHLHRALDLARTAHAACGRAASAMVMGTVLMDLGLDEEATSAFQQALSLTPNADVQKGARDALDELAKRPPLEREASAAEKEDALLLYRSGVGARLEGKPEVAIQALRRSYALWPHPITIVQISLAHRAAGREVEARLAAERALAIAEKRTGKRAVPRLLRGHFGPVRDVAWSPDRRYIATLSADRTVILWDAVTGAVVHTFTLARGLGEIVRFNADGTRLFGGGGTLKGLWSWDVASGEALGSVVLPSGAADVSTDGRLVAIGGERTPVSVRVLDGGAVRWTADSAAGARVVRFSPDGAVLAVGFGTRCVLFRSDTGAVIAEWKTADRAQSIAFSADGAAMALGSHAEVTLHDAATGRRLHSMTGAGLGQGLAFSADGRTLLRAGGTKVALHDVATGKARASYAHPGMFVGGLALAPDGNSVAIAGGREQVFVIDAERGTAVRTLGDESGILHAVALSPDGSRLAFGGKGTGLWLWRLDRVAQPERLLQQAGPQTPAVRWIAFSRDGRRMFSSTMDADGILWDARGGRVIAELPGAMAGVFGTRGDDDTLVVTEGAGDVRLLSARDGSVRGRTQGKGTTRSSAIALGPDDAWVAVGRDDSVRVQAAPLTPNAGRGLVEYRNADEPSALVFVPGTDLLLAAPHDEGFGAFDVRRPSPPTVIKAHDSDARALALAPSGTLLASGGGDGSVRVWRLPGLEPVGAPFEGHLGPVDSVAFSADERTIASASKDKTVLLSDAATRELLATIFVDGDRWLVLAEDGRVDGNAGAGADDPMYWQVGDIRLPSFVGWDRARTPNLVNAILNRP